MHRGEAHPATRSAFLGVELLDQPADWGRLREAMDRASRVVIRMRQKVVVPPLPTTPPRWVVDPDFDLDYHLRRIALPAPGTLRQLLDLAEVTLQSPLDASRALWEAVYVEGLEGGPLGAAEQIQPRDHRRAGRDRPVRAGLRHRAGPGPAAHAARAHPPRRDRR